MTTYNQLKAEREQLKKRLSWLGIRSTGSERLERRIAEIDRKLARPPDRVREALK